MMAARNDTIGEDMYVAKVLDQPFQLGLVLTHPVDLGSIPGHRYFYYCLNSFAQRQDQMVTIFYVLSNVYSGGVSECAFIIYAVNL